MLPFLTCFIIGQPFFVLSYHSYVSSLEQVCACMYMFIFVYFFFLFKEKNPFLTSHFLPTPFTLSRGFIWIGQIQRYFIGWSAMVDKVFSAADIKVPLTIVLFFLILSQLHSESLLTTIALEIFFFRHLSQLLLAHYSALYLR